MLRSDFKYNGKSLSDFGMKMYDADQDPQGVVRKIDKAMPTSAREVANHYSTYRDAVLEHHFLIIKDPEQHESPYDLKLTDKDMHILKSWLFSTTVPAELIIPMDDEEIDVSYFGVFTDVEYFIPARKTCFGLALTFTCNAPYGFSPVTSKRFLVREADTAGDFVNNIVEFAQMIAPTIIIKTDDGQPFSGETLELTNQNDGGKTMHIKLKDGYHRFEIDGRTKITTGFYMSDGVEKSKALTLYDIGANLFVATQDDYNEKNFQLIDTVSLYWLSLVPGSNVMVFKTTPPENSSAAFHDYSVEIRTRYIIEAGGF